MTAATPFVEQLWPAGSITDDGPPEVYYHGIAQNGDRFGQRRNVRIPRITVYLPEAGRANGTAVVVCPGGGYHILAVDHEGHDVARWLTAKGIAAVVLEYRLIPTPEDDAQHQAEFSAKLSDRAVMRALAAQHDPMMRADVHQAIRRTRAMASAWGIRPDRIGVMGFSAGGHVAITATLFHTPDCKPDFSAPIYPVWFETISIDGAAPPLFMALANNDEFGTLITDTVARMQAAWLAAGVPVEVHAYADGGHGFGMLTRHKPCDGWIDRWYEWACAIGMIPQH
jgi:acetyl esterase/lipase